MDAKTLDLAALTAARHEQNARTRALVEQARKWRAYEDEVGQMACAMFDGDVDAAAAVLLRVGGAEGDELLGELASLID